MSRTLTHTLAVALGAALSALSASLLAEPCPAPEACPACVVGPSTTE